DNSVRFDTIRPLATAVSSTTANGTYGVGSVVHVTVTFNEVVVVSGAPTLLLETGPVDQQAVYVSGSGSDTLAFDDTVVAGDAAGDLDCASAAALLLNGGSITDQATNDAVLTLPAPGAAGSLGANKNIGIETVAPTVLSVTSTSADGTYGVGAV